MYLKNYVNCKQVEEYFPQGRFITKRVPACYDTGPGLNIKSSIPGEFRASAEVVLTWHMTDKLLDKLEQVHSTLPRTFKGNDIIKFLLLVFLFYFTSMYSIPLNKIFIYFQILK